MRAQWPQVARARRDGGIAAGQSRAGAPHEPRVQRARGGTALRGRRRRPERGLEPHARPAGASHDPSGQDTWLPGRRVSLASEP